VRARLSLAFLCMAAPALAQSPRDGFVACVGQRVDSIIIDAQAPTVTRLERVPIIGNVVREGHVVTQDRVIRRFLLLEPGDRCIELRRAESERILRAQPFIADASIDAQPNSRGGVDLVVQTIDETSMIVAGSLSGGAPTIRSARLGSSNIYGQAVHASVAWRYKQNYDDRLELRVADYQFLGQPYVLSAFTYKDALSRDDRVEVMLPFRTDLQRYAWRGMVGQSRTHALFMERDSGQLALSYRREQGEVGGLARFGPPGALSILGLSVTSERTTPDSVVQVTELGFRGDTASAFDGRFTPSYASRVNMLLGVRGIRWMRARGLDALRATHDVPMGIQLGGLVGRGVELFGAHSNDILVAGEMYLGVGNPGLTYRLQAQSEARRTLGDTLWDGMVTSGRIARHSRVSDRHTRVLAVEWGAAHRVRVPHALTLEANDGGLRGYRGAISVGARRLIARLDESVYIASPFEFGDLGLAAFVDGGRIWAGDLPYGQTTDIRGAVGASILLAIPMRSTRTWRLEYAVPLNRVPGASRWELRLTHRDLTSFFWREPNDVAAARARAVPVSVYNWP
jgi:hypothetical protein